MNYIHLIDLWVLYYNLWFQFLCSITGINQYTAIINLFNVVDGCKRKWRVLSLCWSTMKLLGRCSQTNMMDFSFITHTHLVCVIKRWLSVRKSYVEWNSEHTELTLWRYACSRQGYHEEKCVKKEIKKRRPQDIIRVGFPAKLVIALDRNTGQWYVKNFIDEHNHPLAPTDLGCLLHSHRKISNA